MEAVRLHEAGTLRRYVGSFVSSDLQDCVDASAFIFESFHDFINRETLGYINLEKSKRDLKTTLVVIQMLVSLVGDGKAYG